MTPAQALGLARQYHGDQVDKLGEDYVDGHLTRVQAAVAFSGLLAVAAALHDSLEDTDATAKGLLAAGVPEEAIDIVEIVTMREDEGGADG